MNKPEAASHDRAGHYGDFSVVRKPWDGDGGMAATSVPMDRPRGVQISTETRGALDVAGKLWVKSFECIMRPVRVGHGNVQRRR
jgi:hypothetical protein